MRQIGIIIQVHRASTRLPNKCYKQIGDKQLIDIVIDQVKKANIEPIILATSHKDIDFDACEDAAIRNNVLHSHWCWDWNVIGRAINSAKEHNIDVIVRVCSDNPFLNPIDIRRLVYYWQKHPEYQLVKFKNRFGIQLATIDALIESVKHLPYAPLKEREDVTKFIYENPKLFKVKELNHSVDNECDFEEVRDYYENFHHC